MTNLASPAWHSLCLPAILIGDTASASSGSSPWSGPAALADARLAQWSGPCSGPIFLAWESLQAICDRVVAGLYKDPGQAGIATTQTLSAHENAVRRLGELQAQDPLELDIACIAEAIEHDAIADGTAVALLECGDRRGLDYVTARAVELRRSRPDGERFAAAVLGLTGYELPERIPGQGAVGALREALRDGSVLVLAAAKARPDGVIVTAPRGPVRDDTGAVPDDDDEDVLEISDATGSPVEIAAGRQLARTLDAVPGLRAALSERDVVVIVDVPDRLTLQAYEGLSPANLGLGGCRTLVQADAPKASERERRQREFMQKMRGAAPLICLTPDAGTHLPSIALQAAEHRLTLAAIDGGDVAAAIRATTLAAPTAADRAALAGLRVTGEQLGVAVRPGRTPAQCVAHLVRLATPPQATGRGRDLTLDDLHGAREAVAWARSTIRDLEGWRAGEPWSTVSNGALMFGPPGTGKTLIAQAFARSAGIPLVVGSLPQWQSADQAHLGTTLKAMRTTFDEARAKAAGRRGCALLIDEIDTFPDRRGVRHDHADYVVEVVNAFLEQLDGAGGREGVVVIGTTNDRDRVDPAIRRPGRLGKSIEIGLPDASERAAMLRVRLGDDLPGADLLQIAYRTERATGAVIEALVEDARRLARHAGRPLAVDDLLAATVAGETQRDDATLRRIAVHESGHALLAHLDEPSDDIVVALQSRDGSGGWVKLATRDRGVWTRDDAEARIRMLLAGRAAEDALLDSASSGASHDLQQATRMCVEMLSEWGMGERGLVAVAMDPATAMATDPRLRADVREMLDALYGETRETIRRHAGAVRRMAEALVAERRLDGAQVARLIAGPVAARRH